MTRLIPVRTPDEAVARLWSDPRFDPAREACVLWSDGRPAATAPEGLTSATVRITRRTADRLWLEVDASRGPAFVVIAEAWYPGWWARLDGGLVPIHRVNGMLRGIEIPPGAHTLYLRYLPQGFVRGLKLSAVFAGLWLAWAAGEVGLRKRKGGGARR